MLIRPADDASALMVAALHPDLELVAATTVNWATSGSTTATAENSLRVFDHIRVPRCRAYEGVAKPIEPRCRLISSRRSCAATSRARMPADGGYLDIPPSRSSKQSTGAVDSGSADLPGGHRGYLPAPVGPMSSRPRCLPSRGSRTSSPRIMGRATVTGTRSPARRVQRLGPIRRRTGRHQQRRPQDQCSCHSMPPIRRSCRRTIVRRCVPSEIPRRCRRHVQPRSGGSRDTTLPSR